MRKAVTLAAAALLLAGGALIATPAHAAEEPAEDKAATAESLRTRPVQTSILLELDSVTAPVPHAIERPVGCGSECITSPFGMREHPVHGGEIFHEGVDYAPTQGTPIVAIAAGVVTEVVAYDAGGYGAYIVVEHEGIGVETLSAHALEGSVAVSVGETVEAGQQLASVGNTGVSTGPHLHFEVRENGGLVDPEAWLESNVTR